MGFEPKLKGEDLQQIKKLYVDERKTTTQLGELFNTTSATVRRHLKRMGVFDKKRDMQSVKHTSVIPQVADHKIYDAITNDTPKTIEEPELEEEPVLNESVEQEVKYNYICGYCDYVMKEKYNHCPNCGGHLIWQK